MTKSFSKNNSQKRLYLFYLLLVIIALPFTIRAAQQKSNFTPKAQAVCDQSPTPWFSNYYGYSTPTELLPQNALVEAFNQRGQRAGCFIVHTTGNYGLMRVYGEDVEHGYPGMQAGEQVTFFIDGAQVQSSPKPVVWQNDLSSHKVDLLETTPPAPSNHPPVITTSSLKPGKIGKNYKATVKGYDTDLTDKLIMSSINLPPGLSLNRCTTKKIKDRIRITCLINGTPTQAMRRDLTIQLNDGSTTTTHLLSLEIRK